MVYEVLNGNMLIQVVVADAAYMAANYTFPFTYRLAAVQSAPANALYPLRGNEQYVAMIDRKADKLSKTDSAAALALRLSVNYLRR